MSGLRKVWILTAPTGFMNGRRRFDVVEHLFEAELDTAINEAQKADEARLVSRLCFVKNLYVGDVLEEGQPWTPRTIHALFEERYGVTYDPAHLSRKLRASGMHYAKPRPMDPRSPENADEILAEHLAKALGEKDADEEEDEPVVLGFFR